jgi:hypothetical protein
VVAADVDIRLSVLESIKVGLDTKNVDGTTGRVNQRVVLILSKEEVRCHDSMSGVIESRLWYGSVVDSICEVLAKERGSSLEKCDGAGHVHIHTSFDIGDTCVCSSPIGHHVSAT